MDIKELIRLDISPMVTFSTYYDPSIPSWEVADNSMSSLRKLLNFQKGCIFIAYYGLLMDNQSSYVHQGESGVYRDTVHIWVINLIALFSSECAI